MTGVIATTPRIQFFNALGAPLARGKLYTYLAGTTMPAATYQDQALTVKNENPVKLDATGGCVVWLDPNKSYKFVLKDERGITLPGWPVDNVSGASTPTSLGPLLQQYTKAADLADPSGAGGGLVVWLRSAVGAVSSSVARWFGWQTPSVLDFMTDEQRADVLAGTLQIDVSDAVQKAVSHCILKDLDLTVEGLCRLDKPVNIDRAVNATTDEFHIRGRNSRAGFYTSKAISMFSSTLPGFTPGGAGSEWIVFDKLRFEASANTVNCFALDGNAFLRMRVRNSYFRNMRLAYTSNFFQSWYVQNCNIRKMKGIFMEAGIAGDSYVGLDGFGFDLHFSGNVFEEGDSTQSAFLKLAGQYNGGSMDGNLFEGSTGPFLEIAGGGTLNVSGNYFEAVSQSCFKLGKTYNIAFTGNRYGTGSDPSYWPVDCQQAYTVVSNGNFAEGNIYKSSAMSSTKALNDAGFYNTASKGLLSYGDVAYNGKVTDDESHADQFGRLEAGKLLAGVTDYTFGPGRQNVATFQGDGVSGVAPPSGFNWYTTAGYRDTCTLKLFISDVAYGEYTTPVLALSNDLVETTGRLKAGLAVDLPVKNAGTRMAYVPGRMYWDSDSGKLVIGGKSGWETVQSS